MRQDNGVLGDLVLNDIVRHIKVNFLYCCGYTIIRSLLDWQLTSIYGKYGGAVATAQVFLLTVFILLCLHAITLLLGTAKFNKVSFFPNLLAYRMKLTQFYSFGCSGVFF